MDPYRILGIPESASDEEVTAAYRRLARKYHPDLNGGSAAASEKMKEVNAAYDLIRDRRAGKAQEPPRTQYGTAYGPQRGAAQGNAAPEDEGGFETFYGYGPFGPFRVYRTGYQPRRSRPFSLFRFIVTLILTMALLRGCTILTQLYAQYLPDYYETQETGAPPPGETGGPSI